MKIELIWHYLKDRELKSIKYVDNALQNSLFNGYFIKIT